MRLTSFTATAVAVLAGSALLVASPGASSADPTRSSAYGVSVDAGGQNAVPPSPTVESTDGSEHTAGGAGAFPAEAAPLLSGDVLALTAGDDKASVRVTNLKIGNAGASLPPELGQLTAQLGQLKTACGTFAQAPDDGVPDILGQLPIPIKQPTADDFGDFCNNLLDADLGSLASLDTLNVECNGDSGTVTVLGASLLGVALPTEDLENVAPDTKLFPDNPLLDVTLNRQTKGPRGAFTVDGLVISLGGGQAEAVVGSTTCGEGIPQSARASNPDAPTAPAPTPQQGNAPVTG
jgi:hypothetical protein